MYSQYDYSRGGNPNRETLENLLAALEYGEYGLAFSSGLAAITCIFFLFKTGDHFIVSDDVYGGSSRFIRKIAKENY